jgi:hypothetical protein
LIPKQNGTQGIKQKLAGSAVNYGIYNAVPNKAEKPAPYSGGDIVWMKAR